MIFLPFLESCLTLKSLRGGSTQSINILSLSFPSNSDLLITSYTQVHFYCRDSHLFTFAMEYFNFFVLGSFLYNCEVSAQWLLWFLSLILFIILKSSQSVFSFLFTFYLPVLNANKLKIWILSFIVWPHHLKLNIVELFNKSQINNWMNYIRDELMWSGM
jgi:hypothetical protein